MERRCGPFLAEEEPYGFEGSLAIALTNSSISLARAGRGEEAVDALREARDIWRAIAHGDETHKPRFKRAKKNLERLEEEGLPPEIANPMEWSNRRVRFLSGWDSVD
ncbi:hypothetical protein AB0K16_53275 [Nonomuraea jabiensis]|uniref:hypothetical protein n=1 Tax=Nonomuraea jabiensis TaxID=882448 RepID=UPI00341FCA17